jgi:hypothetical protein
MGKTEQQTINNHEVWMVCPVCGQEYDGRMEVHVCEVASCLAMTGREYLKTGFGQ